MKIEQLEMNLNEMMHNSLMPSFSIINLVWFVSNCLSTDLKLIKLKVKVNRGPKDNKSGLVLTCSDAQNVQWWLMTWNVQWWKAICAVIKKVIRKFGFDAQNKLLSRWQQWIGIERDLCWDNVHRFHCGTKHKPTTFSFWYPATSRQKLGRDLSRFFISKCWHVCHSRPNTFSLCGGLSSNYARGSHDRNTFM